MRTGKKKRVRSKQNWNSHNVQLDVIECPHMPQLKRTQNNIHLRRFNPLAVQTAWKTSRPHREYAVTRLQSRDGTSIIDPSAVYLLVISNFKLYHWPIFASHAHVNTAVRFGMNQVYSGWQTPIILLAWQRIDSIWLLMIVVLASENCGLM